MVTPVSDFMGVFQLILTFGIFAILIGMFLLVDFFKRKKNDYLLWTFIIIFVVLVGILLGITRFDIIQVGLTTGITAILIGLYLLLDFLKKKINGYLLWALWAFIIVGAILVITLLVIMSVEILTYYSVHIGFILGFPALTVLTIGAFLVAYDEPKYTIYHGYSAGSSWILTLTNVILLITLTPEQMNDYSGLIHSFHIFCGGIGLSFGFASLLFGISGQRRLAKLTGYITLACWWVALLLGLLLPDI